MATHTTNYNLEKPEASDPFGDFRQSYNSNMDIIDQNLGGGGGGGGHTIIDPNGSDMAQRAGLQFTGSCSVMDDAVNDKTVVNISGGGGNVYGAFIDTDRIIQSATTISGVTTASYTATEDCVVCASVVADYDKASEVKIDNVRVWRNYNGSGGQIANALNVYLRKGQIIAITNGSTSYSGSYTVYGIKQGTSGIFAPVIYSDTERKIGIWRDNKPLYQKTIDLGSDTNISNANWETSVFSISNLEKIILIYGVNSSGTYYPLNAYHSGDDVNLLACRDGNPANIRWVTLQYTKTTDTAGSGDWNTDGVPTVHYDTSEKVIGTWIDGKPIYERTWDFSASPVMLSYMNWVDSGISAGENIKSIMSAELKYGVVTNMAVEVAVGADGYPVAFQKVENTGNTRGVEYCTLRYTKTTD